ncbi:MAG: hypothetical protein HY001_04085 [Candidatus Portnoybacteria bacterium]|nr:hypothetical protein [Candidatus Portnoybacteria bacterium]
MDKEFLKKCGMWCWRVIEMVFELLGFIILMLWEVWFITVIAIFALIAWYFGLLT